MKIEKSLADLDRLADDVLKKSEKPSEEQPPAPADIVDNPPAAPAAAKEENPEQAAAAAEQKPETAGKTEGDDAEGKDDDTVKKSDQVDALPSAGNGEGEDEDEPEPDKEQLEKSLQGEFTNDDEIMKGMDASEFLSSVVEILTKSLADVQYDVQLSSDDARKSNAVLVKSLQATLSLNKSMADELAATRAENADLRKSIETGFADMRATLEEVLSQPTSMRKSVSDIQVKDRNFQKSLNGAGAGSSLEGLSKSQVLGILSDELYKSNPNVSTADIISYESGAPLRPELAALVANRRQ